MVLVTAAKSGSFNVDRKKKSNHYIGKKTMGTPANSRVALVNYIFPKPKTV